MASPHATKEERREVLPGFPVEVPFETGKEVWEYLRGERIQCLRCGKWYKALGGHLTVHGWTVEEYKAFYGLPVSGGRGLTCSSTHQLVSVNSKVIAETYREESLARLAHHRPAIQAARKGMDTRPAYAKADGPKHLGKHLGKGGERLPETVWATFLDRMREGRMIEEVMNDSDMPTKTTIYAKRKADPDFDAALQKITLPGFPVEGLLPEAEVLKYLDEDPLTCLLCGRKYDALGKHLKMAHGIKVKEYCERYGIPFRWKGRQGLITNRAHEERSRNSKSNTGVMARAKHLHKTSPASHSKHQPFPQSEGQKRIRRFQTNPPRKCPVCGEVKVFPKKNRTCERACGTVLRIRENPQRPKRTCVDCGKKLSDGSQSNGVKRCQSCYNKIRGLPPEERAQRQRESRKRAEDKRKQRRRDDPEFAEKLRARDRARKRNTAS